MDPQLEFNFGITLDSDFRLWINEQWFQYKDEVEQWERKQVTGSPKAYFNKYKWFLKAKYKAENK